VIDSPGGSAMGCQEACDIAEQMSKPIVAFVAGYGCSAAYRFACYCDQIFATKSAQVGSIGTALLVEDRSKQYAEAGVEVVAATTGEFKSFGRDGLPVTAEHRQFMAERVAVEQAGFVASLTARGLTPEQQAKVSDGRYWSAAEALQLGLIDGIKSVTEVTDGAVLLVGNSVPGVVVDVKDTEQLIPAGQIEGSDIVSGGTGQPAAQTGEVQVISIAEIKQLCPGASSDFILQQAELPDNTKVKVLQSFQALLNERIDSLKKSNDEAAAAKQQADVEQQRIDATLGKQPVGSTTLTQSVADGATGKGLTGGVIQQFESLVDEAVKGGASRQSAVGIVVQENPEMHGQYLAAIKQMTPEQKDARRRRHIGVLSGDFSRSA
jgi:signal peptide peptidase SppA